MTERYIHPESINFFEKNIMAFYRAEGREYLPWRKEGISIYEVWVSEIMLQQTQVDRVIDFYTRFLERFPTVEILAKASWEEFLPYYQGLGYYRRGRNMLDVARIVMSDYGGNFPMSIEALQKLPGIGPYTARAIVSFALNEDHLAWDTNFKRVFGRFFFGSKDAAIDSAIFEKKITADKRDFNGAIMDFGSLVRIRKPKCEVCLLKEKCTYFKRDGERENVLKNRTVVKERFGLANKGSKSRADSSTSLRFGWNDKTKVTILILHENHKVYFSSLRKSYQPFRLSAGIISREDIKRYFLKKYQLELALRPPQKKFFYRGQAAQLVYAQILLGSVSFARFTKEEAQAILETKSVV